MQWSIDHDDVTNLDHVFDPRMKRDVELFFGCLGQALAIEVVQVDIESDLTGDFCTSVSKTES
jgi:hypothetical protein